MVYLSDSAHHLAGQPMFRLLDRVQKLERQGRKVHHFELGEPDFQTPGHIVRAGCEAIRGGDTHYTNSKGLFELREPARQTTRISRGFTPELQQVIVTPGANAIIYLPLSAASIQGTKCWCRIRGSQPITLLLRFVARCRFTYRFWRRTASAWNLRMWHKKSQDRTWMLILNSPSNPTGGVNSPEDNKVFSEIAETHDISVLSDEICAGLILMTIKGSAASVLAARARSGRAW